MLPDRSHGTECGELEIARAGGVPPREVAHEVLRDGERHGGIARGREPDLAWCPVHEEDVELLVDSPDVGDRNSEWLEPR